MQWFGRRHQVEQLVGAHYESLYRYAFRLSGSSSEAEDLTQETFCQAQSKLGQLRDATRAKAWLFSILRNAYLRRLRVSKQEHRIPFEDLGEIPERPSEPLPEVDPGQLQQALSELPEAYRTPVILFYFEEFSYRAIAEHIEVPIGTVMSRLARAKLFLRQKLLPAIKSSAEEAGRLDGRQTGQPAPYGARLAAEGGVRLATEGGARLAATPGQGRQSDAVS
jgi:RNA polymerase sigma-70 factor (ECF subfamily)